MELSPRYLRQASAKFAQRGTTEVSDAMGKTGGVPGVLPIFNNLRSIAGPVHYVEAYGESNWSVHEGLRDVPPGSIVFVECFDVDERAIFGWLVAKYIWLKRGSLGIVVNGAMRDMQDLIQNHAPVWSRGASPVGCYNRPMPPPSAEVRGLYEATARKHYDDPRGGIIVADASGVVVVPRDKIAHAYHRLHEIEQLEHDWFRALDEGMDTYEIVCLRKYEEKTKG